MNFVKREPSINLSNKSTSLPLLWERESNGLGDIFGELVIVVIDDHWRGVLGKKSATDLTRATFANLRYLACEKWQETQAIGFFELRKKTEDADEILRYIQDWVKKVTPQGRTIRVRYLVDALYGPPESEDRGPANYIVEKLQDSTLGGCIAYITRAGTGIGGLRDGVPVLAKGLEVESLRNNDMFTSEFMEFLGLGRHKDSFINNAIQFYAGPWETNRLKCTCFRSSPGWCHDCLENKESQQLKALADWLGDSISPEDLIDESPDGDGSESAKSLMIWNVDNNRNQTDLWDSPPWRSRDRRSIRWKVLNAVVKKLGIALNTPIPLHEDETIIPPCVPCFPFLVSLKNFLWHREERGRLPVKEVCFFKLGKKPQVNIFRLVLTDKDREAPYKLAKRLFGMWEPGKVEDPGASTKSLISLVHCRTDGLSGSIGKDYMRLFNEGTELPIVALETAPSQINLIWSVK